MFTSRKKLLLVLAAAGIAVKAAEFLWWSATPFRFYNGVPGLDMQTLLRFGEWGAGPYGFFFTPHRALVALFWKLNGEKHFVPGIVAVQALVGVGGALLCADLALKFFRKRWIAAVLGIFYLCYGPFFVYEFAVLQETVALHLLLLGFYAAVTARSRRGMLFAGFALALSVIGRPSGFLFVPALALWMLFRRGFTAKNGGALAAGAAAALLPASLLNRIFGGSWSCFFNVLPYSLEFNAANAPAAGDPYAAMVVNAVSRVPRLFSVLELPENLNYYFLADRMPPLGFLPSPLLLIPVGCAGMVLLLWYWKKPAASVLIPVLTLALPLCVRDPIGRYRLTLIPYFILGAGAWLAYLAKKPMRRHLLVAGALLGLFSMLAAASPKPYHRASDYLTHALALEAESGGRTTPASLECLLEGWRKSGFCSNPLGVNLFLRLLESGKADPALAVLHTGIANSPQPDVYRYYLAVMKADRGEFAAAEALLGECDPGKLGFLAGKYHYLAGEMLRRRGDRAGAEREYREALKLVDAKFAPRVREALNAPASAAAEDRSGGTGGAPLRAPDAR